jgi:uncharacterized protein YcbX
MTARLSRITIYPIKSLDGVSVDEVEVLPAGPLSNDRRFALVDEEGGFINGKRTAAMHCIRAAYDLASMRVQLRRAVGDQTADFSLAADRLKIGDWLRRVLDVACHFEENAAAGFPDDTDAPGPTLISTATLREVASWFPGLPLDETRRRFRANLEIDGVDAFWEDRLVGPKGHNINFAIGSVKWLGVNPCQRCVVPTRAAETGEVTPAFQRHFAERRRGMIPSWAPADRFDHYYRLAVNTRLAPGQANCRLSVGDPVEAP